MAKVQAQYATWRNRDMKWLPGRCPPDTAAAADAVPRTAGRPAARHPGAAAPAPRGNPGCRVRAAPVTIHGRATWTVVDASRPTGREVEQFLHWLRAIGRSRTPSARMHAT